MKQDNKKEQNNLLHKLNDTFPLEDPNKYKQVKKVIKKNQTKKKEEK